MRKTLLFITLIAGLLLASCDKDNPDSNNGQSDNTEKPSDDGEKLPADWLNNIQFIGCEKLVDMWLEAAGISWLKKTAYAAME